MTAKMETSWSNMRNTLIWLQMLFGLLMQLSFIAVPGYNFGLGVMGMYCAQSKSPSSIWMTFLSLLILSMLADIIWISLWGTGSNFNGSACGAESINIFQC